MKRREFVKLCGSAIALVYANPNVLATPSSELKSYSKILLVDEGGTPIKSASLKNGESFIFHYPYVGTPAFLINVGVPVEAQTIDNAGSKYQWSGGVGANHSIVAFSAICSHQFSYPSKATSFINYQSTKSKVAGRDKVIVCCAHQTVFDPLQGARAISGPTKKPLTTVVLEYDSKTDYLYAVATQGEEQYEDFFRAYKRELIESFGRGKAKQAVTSNAVLISAQKYSSQRLPC